MSAGKAHMVRRNWTRDELLVAFDFYCRTPFGLFHGQNPDVIRLAEKIGRTPGAVAMKLCNFASFDPAHQARNVKGLGNAGRNDRQVWDEFNANPEALVIESQEAFNRIVRGEVLSTVEKEWVIPEGPTEAMRTIRTRLVQAFFRDAVLTSYDYRCAICGLAITELLSASHIIPWSKNAERRADPRNGLSLCAIHDRAFDRGFVTLDDSLKVLVSEQLKLKDAGRLHRVALLEIESKTILMPSRFAPDPDALVYHRKHIFR